MLTAILGHLELTDFADSNVIIRGKYADFFELGGVHKRRHHSRGAGGLPKDDLT